MKRYINPNAEIIELSDVYMSDVEIGSMGCGEEAAPEAEEIEGQIGY